MATDVIMPQLGESIAEGTIVKWLKKPGDTVQRDEALLVVSTDKVEAEIPSPAAGTLLEIRVKDGETVPIKSVLAVLGAAGEPAGAVASRPSPAGTNGTAPKAGPEPDALHLRPLDDVVPPVAVPPVVAQGVLRSSGGAAHVVRTTPLVRRLADEEGVDLSAVVGTGQGGRVSKRDVLDYIEQRKQGKGPVAAPSAGPAQAPALRVPAPAGVEVLAPEFPALPESARYEIHPMSPMRRSIAKHMVESKRTSAHVQTFFEINMSKVWAAREADKERFKRDYDIGLTFTAYIARATVNAIADWPIVNSRVVDDNVVLRRDVNLGIAVALDDGLIVPVVKGADQLNLAGLARAINDLSTRARNRKLKPDEVADGTFSITNPGIFGSLYGTPIINQPQVAILGCGVIEKRPVVIDDNIAVRPMMYLALSFDHRIIDGAVADQFMANLKKRLENWGERVY